MADANKYGWFCTDDDCAQYCKKDTDADNDYTYKFIQVLDLNYPTEKNDFNVVQASIDLAVYTVDEMREVIEPYGYTLEGLVKDYGFVEALRLVAECAFESLSFYYYKLLLQNAKEDEARAYVKAYIEAND